MQAYNSTGKLVGPVIGPCFGTVTEAFVALDSVATDIAQSGVPRDAIELVVVDEQGKTVPRPDTH